MCCPLFLSLTYGQRMLQADFHLLICLVCLRGPSWGKWPSDTSLTLDNPRLGEWSGERVWFIFLFMSCTVLKHPSLVPLMKHLEWEADYSKPCLSVMNVQLKKITTHDHTLHLALRQPVLIWDWVALTQVQAISNTMIICCHTKDRLSSGNSVQSVLDFKSGGISLSLTDCAPLASHLCGPASSSLHKIVSRVPPAFRGVHRFMPLSIILWYTVIKTISQLF